MKYDVWSRDPNPDNGDLEWISRARGVNESKAMKLVRDLLNQGYDRDLSIQVNQIEPVLPFGAGLDIELPGELTEPQAAKGKQVLLF